MKNNWNFREKLLVATIVEQILDSLSYEDDINLYCSSESLLISLCPDDVNALKKLVGYCSK